MKRICALIFVLALTAGTAAAEVKEFSKLSIDIPAGWSVEEIAGTVAAIKDDKTAALTVSVEPFEVGRGLLDMARIFSQKFKGTPPKRADNESYTFTFNDGKSQAVITSRVTSYVLVTTTGLVNAPQELYSMIASLNFKH